MEKGGLIVGILVIGAIAAFAFFGIKKANAGVPVKTNPRANPVSGSPRNIAPPRTMEVQDGTTTGSNNSALPYAESAVNLACQIKGGNAQACEGISKLTKFTPLGYVAGHPDQALKWGKTAFKITPVGAAITYGPAAFKRGTDTVKAGVNSVINSGGKAMSFVRKIF